MLARPRVEQGTANQEARERDDNEHQAGFVTASVGFLAGARWWLPVTAATASLSLVLCAAWWNDAYAGALIDAAILVLLAGMALWARPSWA